MSNSVKQIVDFLDTTVVASENTIMKAAFGYDRNNSRMANKKYADMLRRGLKKGLYNRAIIKVKGVRPRVFYFKGTKQEFVDDLIDSNFDELIKFIIQNEGHK